MLRAHVMSYCHATRLLKSMASSLKEEIRSAVKETLKEELSRALSEHKNTAEKQANDCKAGTSKRTKSFEEFYKEREADRQKGSNQEKERRKMLRFKRNFQPLGLTSI